MSDSAQHDHERLRQDLAGYVIGGLTLDEQHAVESHLGDCPACRDELIELDPLPVLLELSAISTPEAATTPTALGLVPVGRTIGDGGPPTEPPTQAPLVFPMTSGDAETPSPFTEASPARRTRRRSRLLVGSGAAALALAAAFLIGLVVAGPHEAPYSAPVALHASGGSTATGTVAVRAEPHGTDVKLKVAGLPTSGDGTYYECIWWTKTKVRSAGTFKVTRAGPTELELVTAADLAPGWQLGILEHPGGNGKPVTVLTSPT